MFVAELSEFRSFVSECVERLLSPAFNTREFMGWAEDQRRGRGGCGVAGRTLGFQRGAERRGHGYTALCVQFSVMGTDEVGHQGARMSRCYRQGSEGPFDLLGPPAALAPPVAPMRRECPPASWEFMGYFGKVRVSTNLSGSGGWFWPHVALWRAVLDQDEYELLSGKILVSFLWITVWTDCDPVAASHDSSMKFVNVIDLRLSRPAGQTARVFCQTACQPIGSVHAGKCCKASIASRPRSTAAAR